MLFLIFQDLVKKVFSYISKLKLLKCIENLDSDLYK